MPHKVEISDKTYEDLKEFCNLNDLKIGQFADKLIREGLMIEMYGDVPFTNYKRLTQDQVEAVKTAMVNLKKLENPHEDEIRDSGDIMFGNQDDVAEAIDKHMGEIVGFKREGAGGPDIILTRREVPEMRAAREKADEADTSAEENHVNFLNAPPVEEVYIKEKKKLEEKILEEVGVPRKVMNRITRRRLK